LSITHLANNVINEEVIFSLIHDINLIQTYEDTADLGHMEIDEESVVEEKSGSS